MSRRGGRPGKKVVVRAECVARLKGGATPVELLREYSPGSVYDAVKEYLAFSAGEVKAAKGLSEEVQLELARLQGEAKAARESLAARRAEVESLMSRRQGLDREVRSREDRVALLKADEARLDQKLEEYSRRGITDKTFGWLDRIDFRGERDILERLKTIDEYIKLLDDTNRKGDELRNMEARLKILRSERGDLKGEVAGLEVKRDEELSKNYVQSESIRILSTFYADGYTSDDIEGIRIALSTLGLGGDSRISVRRLVDFLGGEMELSRLKGEIEARRGELEVLDETILKVKSQIEGYNEVALAALVKSEAESKTRIGKAYSDTVGRVNSVGDVVEKRIMEISDNNVEAMSAAAKAGVGNLIDIHTLAKRNIDGTVDLVREEVRKTIRSEFEPYRDSFQLLPKMQPFVSYGHVLLNVPMDKKYAYQVPPIFVANTATAIDCWVKEMLPEAMTKIPDELSIIAPLLQLEAPCKLFVVSAWLRYELAKNIRFR